jgi:hypothetical protein
MAAPVEPLLSELRGAIWADLQLNGMIGNGNEVAALWLDYWGSENEGRPLHILDLVCHGNNTAQRCRFDMLREGGTITVDGKSVPDRIRCRAAILRDEEGNWHIPHVPPNPRSGGHSRTTLRCKWAASH